MLLTKKLSFWVGLAIVAVLSGLLLHGIANINFDATPARQQSQCIETATQLLVSTSFVACSSGKFIDIVELDDEVWLVCRCLPPAPTIQIFPNGQREEAPEPTQKQHVPTEM